MPKQHLALLSAGFRPFFLGASAMALGLVVLWLLVLSGTVTLNVRYGIVFWHQHEMIFGYTMAGVAGFLLTAVQNWTKTPMPQGSLLLGLTLLWLAGRTVVYLPLAPLGMALIDAAFPATLAWLVAMPIVAKRQWRNCFFPLILLGLAGANLLSYFNTTGQVIHGHRLALGLIVALIVMMASRLLPLFIAKMTAGNRENKSEFLNDLPMMLVLAYAVSQAFLPQSWWVGSAAFLAGLVFGARLIRWHIPKIWTQPLLWSMYISALWIAFGLVLVGAASVGLASFSQSVHVLTLGGIGLMMLSVMIRVSLGHSGRPMVCPRGGAWAFVLINATVIIRAFLPALLPGFYPQLLMAAGLCWLGAYAIFTLRMIAIWLKPSVSSLTG